MVLAQCISSSPTRVKKKILLVSAILKGIALGDDQNKFHGVNEAMW